MSKNNRNFVKKAKAKADKRERVKRTRIVILAVSAALVLSVLGALLLSSVPKYAEIVAENGRYTDQTTGIVYAEAPFYWEPVSCLTDRPYGKRDGNFVYPIEGQSTDHWLAEEEDGYYRLYYAESLTLPEPESFSSVTVGIYTDSALVQKVASITDAAETGELIGLLSQGGEPENLTVGGTKYLLKITSTRYPGLAFCLPYIETAEGNYMQDPRTGRIVEVGNRIAGHLRDIAETADGEGRAAP